MSFIPKNILIIRLSAIGDAVMTTALLQPIKKRYPNSRLYWLAENTAASLLIGHPHIDEVIILPRKEWRTLWQNNHYLQLLIAIKEFIRLLRSKNIELALDAQGLLKSGLFAWLCGAPERIGLGSKEGSQWLMTKVLARDKNAPAICSEYEHLANFLQLETATFFMDLPVTPAVLAQTQALLRLQNIATQKPYIVICPFTTRPQKHWRDQHWQHLINDYLSQYHGAIILMGSQENHSHAAQLMAGVIKPSFIVDLVGKTNLQQASAIIQQAQLVIGVDTGLTHMGIAHNTPTIAIFGSTRPYTITRRNNATVLYHDMPCAPCHRRPSCNGKFTCMQEVMPSTVFQHAQPWLL